MFSGTHENPVLEAGILEKLIETVIEMAEKDKENVSVKMCIGVYLICDELQSDFHFRLLFGPLRFST